LLVSFFGVSDAEAASLYFDPASTTIAQGETLVLTVRLDTTPSECINAIDGVIELDPGLTIVDVSTGNSIFNLWVEQPQVNENRNGVTFAGGVTNGYCGRIEGDPQLTNSILNIIVQTPSFSIGDTGAAPERTIRFAPETAAYRNDGLGSRAALTTMPATISVTDRYAGPGDVWQDAVRSDVFPPKQFSINLVQNENAYHGKYYIVFNTTDKETGIDHYEVMEEPREEFDLFNWGAADAPWIDVTSPYVLEDQTLNSTIRVKAIDKAGNEYIATLIPDDAVRGAVGPSPVLIFMMLLAFIAVITALLLIVLALRRRSRDDDEFVHDEEIEHGTDGDSDDSFEDDEAYEEYDEEIDDDKEVSDSYENR